MQNIKIFQKGLVKEKANNEILSQVLKIAIPGTLQSLLASSFNFVDQIMVGSLGSTAITAIAFAGKITNIYGMLIYAIQSTIAIMIAQYWGKKDIVGINKILSLNTYTAFIILSIFTFATSFFPEKLISIFTKDINIIPVATEYLRIIGVSFIALAGFNILTPLFKIIGYNKALLYISFISLSINTTLNYALILGRLGMPNMGVRGAAIATVISKYSELTILLILCIITRKKGIINLSMIRKINKKFIRKTLCILLPVLMTQLLWSLGDTAYGIIYGRMSSDSMAAMSMTWPLQGITMSLFAGLSAATGIIIGNKLGKKEYVQAHNLSKKFIKYSITFSIITSLIILIISDIYPKLYNVSPSVASSADKIIGVFALFTSVKVCMSVASSFICSGGKTKYITTLSFLGTFLIGIPLGFVAAFVWKLPIQSVYFLISIEEVIRLIISLFIWKSKNWIQDITEEDNKDKVAQAAGGVN